MPDYPLTASPSEVLQASLDCLFHVGGDLTQKAELEERAVAFENLAGLFVAQQSEYDFEDLQFDGIALRLMLGRFHRDAFGVHNLERHLHSLVRNGEVQPAIVEQLMERVYNLGVRINSSRPMRTRIAAAFSLWMCTLRPICLGGSKARHDVRAGKFCAALTFWVASQYLRKFGDVKIGTPRDAQKRYERVHHDFTFRDLNLSSLEMLYCSIFHPESAEGASLI